MNDDRHSGAQPLAGLKPSRLVVEMTIQVSFKNRLTGTGRMLLRHPCHTWLFLRGSSHQLIRVKIFLKVLKFTMLQASNLRPTWGLIVTHF